MRQKSNEYFDGFVSQMEYACRAAAFLKDLISPYQPAMLESKVVEMHEIEHAADVAKHAIIEKLAKEFITPIEREDIMMLFQQIDDVTDYIEDVVRKMYMFNVKTIRQEAPEFVDIILQCCNVTREALSEIYNFQKSEKIHPSIIRVNELEEMGDRLHRDAMRRLYTEDAEPLERITWTKMFDWLEACCDACEDVTDSIEMIIMKNA